MAHDHHSPPTSPSARRGFWIILGAALFQAGYPVLLSTAFGADYRAVGVALLFAFLAVLMFAGITWARVLSVGLSGLISFVFIAQAFTFMAMFGDKWPFLLLLFLIPTLGYGSCLVLLCHRSVHEYLRDTVQIRLAKTLSPLSAPNPIEHGSIDEQQALQACPWCEAIAVRTTDTSCPACGRPV